MSLRQRLQYMMAHDTGASLAFVSIPARASRFQRLRSAECLRAECESLYVLTVHVGVGVELVDLGGQLLRNGQTTRPRQTSASVFQTPPERFLCSQLMSASKRSHGAAYTRSTSASSPGSTFHTQTSLGEASNRKPRVPPHLLGDLGGVVELEGTDPHLNTTATTNPEAVSA
jgi:hypothetical protein